MRNFNTQIPGAQQTPKTIDTQNHTYANITKLGKTKGKEKS
jgi:hypothetical protein